MTEDPSCTVLMHHGDCLMFILRALQFLSLFVTGKRQARNTWGKLTGKMKREVRERSRRVEYRMFEVNGEPLSVFEVLIRDGYNGKDSHRYADMGEEDWAGFARETRSRLLKAAVRYVERANARCGEPLVVHGPENLCNTEETSGLSECESHAESGDPRFE